MTFDTLALLHWNRAQTRARAEYHAHPSTACHHCGNPTPNPRICDPCATETQRAGDRMRRHRKARR